ncbi:MAG TPA: hypothetical protein V6D10_06935 [Trichocoleus sp.]|jgi:hypothetical protein
MADNSEIEKIQRSISGREPYFLPDESPPNSGRFIQPEVSARPGEVLKWFDGFTLNQSFRDLIQGLENNSDLKLRITSFTGFSRALQVGPLQLSFNTESSSNDQGLLAAAGIEVEGVKIGDLIEVQNVGLSLAYEPSKPNNP